MRNAIEPYKSTKKKKTGATAILDTRQAGEGTGQGKHLGQQFSQALHSPTLVNWVSPCPTLENWVSPYSSIQQMQVNFIDPAGGAAPLLLKNGENYSELTYTHNSCR